MWLFTLVLADDLLYCLNDSESHQLSRTLQSIPVNFNSAVVWIISIVHLINSSSIFFMFFGIVSNTPTLIGITVTFIFLSRFSSNNSPYSLRSGLNISTSVLQGWSRHEIIHKDWYSIKQRDKTNHISFSRWFFSEVWMTAIPFQSSRILQTVLINRNSFVVLMVSILLLGILPKISTSTKTTAIMIIMIIAKTTTTIIIIIIIIIPCEFFTLMLADGFSQGDEWQQVSCCLHDSSEYSG